MAKRRARRLDLGADVNIDPLMDVVTCVVGIMLFIVIFAVIEARGSRVEMVTPRLQSPPPGSTRHVFLCARGRVREFPIDSITARFWEQRGRLTYDSTPRFVERFNEDGFQDRYFSYRAEYETDRGIYSNKRKVYLVAEERPDRLGESVEDLEGPQSTFGATIRTLDRTGAWVSFIVDAESIDVFRTARDLAITHGVAVGWDPASLTFPYRSCVVGCGSAATEGLAAGPQTG